MRENGPLPRTDGFPPRKGVLLPAPPEAAARAEEGGPPDLAEEETRFRAYWVENRMDYRTREETVLGRVRELAPGDRLTQAWILRVNWLAGSRSCLVYDHLP